MSKVEEIGGGYFGCFDDVGNCILTCCLPCVTWGQAMEDAGEGSCIMHGCLLYCCPCWLPIATAGNQENIDKKMGGQGAGFLKTCCCHCLCPYCAICMVSRAVTKGKQQGLLKPNGAPATDIEMTK